VHIYDAVYNLVILDNSYSVIERFREALNNYIVDIWLSYNILE